MAPEACDIGRARGERASRKARSPRGIEAGKRGNDRGRRGQRIDGRAAEHRQQRRGRRPTSAGGYAGHQRELADIAEREFGWSGALRRLLRRRRPRLVLASSASAQAAMRCASASASRAPSDGETAMRAASTGALPRSMRPPSSSSRICTSRRAGDAVSSSTQRDLLELEPPHEARRNLEPGGEERIGAQPVAVDGDDAGEARGRSSRPP